MDDVRDYLRQLGVKNRRTVAKDADGWRGLLREDKAQTVL